MPKNLKCCLKTDTMAIARFRDITVRIFFAVAGIAYSSKWIYLFCSKFVREALKTNFR